MYVQVRLTGGCELEKLTNFVQKFTNSKRRMSKKATLDGCVESVLSGNVVDGTVEDMLTSRERLVQIQKYQKGHTIQ